jgi:formamidopyrimidine-DNA glycosylase
MTSQVSIAEMAHLALTLVTMPELPEVETVMRGLAPALVGQRIARVDLRRSDLRFPFPLGFAERLTGARVDALTRRAKYILAHLDTGELLILHLGMTGRFTVLDGADANTLGAFYFETGSDLGADGPHDHVVFHLESGARVVYNDPRRFGMMDLSSDGFHHKLLRDIGIEPLGNELSGAYLAEKFKGKAAPMKAALLDQRIVAGLGNIYVSEALFRAHINPRKKAGTLVKAKSHDVRLDALADHVRAILNEAIAAGGSTLQDYRGVDGTKGDFQQRFSVYDREGEPCVTRGCVSTITRIVQSGRSTFYCPTCQR